MVKIVSDVHSIDGLEHPIPGVGIVPYLIEENPNDLTLIDTCFLSELRKFEAYVTNAGYDMNYIRRIILTHVHIDHVQAANEIKRRSGAKLYSHWVDAAYLANDPIYSGPPSHQTLHELLQKFGVKKEDLIKKFGSLEREPILVEEQLKDGDRIGNLQVIHTPGHTPGHISLFYEKQGIIFGADFLFNSVFGIDGLFVPPSAVTIDPLTAAVSAKRVSKMNFEKLLLAHQSAPILEDAQIAVEEAALAAINKSE